MNVRIQGMINGEPYDIPDGYCVVRKSERDLGNAALVLLSDLDRSPIGRHRGDMEAESPTGRSGGNPLLPPGTHIGYTIWGGRIVVPEDTSDPEAWLAESGKRKP